jgi:hypothetical protein
LLGKTVYQLKQTNPTKRMVTTNNGVLV